MVLLEWSIKFDITYLTVTLLQWFKCIVKIISEVYYCIVEILLYDKPKFNVIHFKFLSNTTNVIQIFESEWWSLQK